MLEPVGRLGVVGASLRGKGVRLREESPQAAWRVSERHVPSFKALDICNTDPQGLGQGLGGGL